MTKKILILTVTALASAVLAGTAFAVGKPAILLPGGTYLNQAATSGLSCLGGTDTATGTTTFLVSVPNGQSTQGATLQLDYSFDPDDPALLSYSGTATVHAQTPATGVQAIPVEIPVSSDDGSVATVINSSVLSIDSTGTLLFDATGLTAWACGTPSTAQGGGGTPSPDTGCTGYQPLLDSLTAAAARNELKNKVVESQRECLKNHFSPARHKLDEFIREAAKPKYDPTQSVLWILMAQNLRDSLPLPAPKK